MGKHNGKSRSTGGVKVGAALTRRHKGGGASGGNFQDRHTTDVGGGMQSILERNDLDELMAMAELADRDFTAERYQPVVITTSAHTALAAEQSAAARVEAEQRNEHKLHIPRRPEWDSSTTPEQLDAQEKAAFLDWRRQLAHLEEEEGLLLTPFERNLEVWRQLWRVLERSDIVVQVVDARDPMTYLSQDLVAFAHELHQTKDSFVLLNKADLLPEQVRAAWADYFDARGINYGFWSAYVASEAQAKAKHDANAYGLSTVSADDVNRYFYELLGIQQQQQQEAADSSSSRTKILTVEELLDRLEQLAQAAVDAADDDDPRRSDPNRRLMIGLVGYPNVGKSSTINAIFGAKKTAVAPTPGKTKHFQTLNVSPTICLCDCPGLVFPRFAASKADMVAAGVIPIDRLTDIRAPIEVVAARCGQQQLEAVYGIQLSSAATAAAGGSSSSSSSTQGVQQHQQLTAGTRLLVSLARARGWVASGGLPDEARAGRQILRDYTNGKLLYCRLPPSGNQQQQQQQRGFAPTVAPLPGTVNGLKVEQHQQHHQQQQQQMEQGVSSSSRQQQQGGTDRGTTASGSSSSSTPHTAAHAAPAGAESAAENPDGADLATAVAAEGDDDGEVLLLSDADLELMEGLGIGSKAKPKRPDHKFHKKVARTKGSRGIDVEVGGYDGAAIKTGKKGGLVRVGGY